MKEKYIILRAYPAEQQRNTSLAAGPHRMGDGRAMEASVEVDEFDARSASMLNRRDPTIIGVAPAMPIRLIHPFEAMGGGGSHSGYSDWGIWAVRASDSILTGSSVTIAVLDTGIDISHAAFAGIDIVGRNFTSDVDRDRVGHGTHCAGTIFGRDVEGIRIGVARGVKKALIGKVIGGGGESSDTVAKAIIWAIDQGAHVISMSLGIDFPGYQTLLCQQGFPNELATSRALEGYSQNVRLFEHIASLARAREHFAHPVLFVAAAGNESRRNIDPEFRIAVGPPAASEGILAVAAVGRMNKSLSVAPFSNVGAQLCAPGVEITSARFGGGLSLLSGTSMAAPHVAGVAALWAEKLMSTRPLRAYEWVGRLIGSASVDQFDSGFDHHDVGAGLVCAPQS